MATPAQQHAFADSPITLKITLNGVNRKFKLPLRDLAPATFEEKIRSVLNIPSSQKLQLERFSDTAAAFVSLGPGNTSAHKQLYRAAKAKSKLRLRATTDLEKPSTAVPETKAPKPSPDAPMPTFKPSTLDSTPLPQVTPSSESNPAKSRYYEQLIGLSRERELGRRLKEPPPPQQYGASWQVCCNNCNASLKDAHLHCSICDGGDYDLCEPCVSSGVVCPGKDHWLIKRYIKNGEVVNSHTEKVAPKAKAPAQPTVVTQDAEASKPIAEKATVAKSLLPTPPVRRRTCNSCVRVLTEDLLVNCADCDDYDLCIPCVSINKHGHHPGHTFKPIVPEKSKLDAVALLCAPGRGQRHNAFCDGCDKHIYGARHKCLDCPDFDFCNTCFKSASEIHPGHRFVTSYHQIDPIDKKKEKHTGVFCDGPLCANAKRQTYIDGTRYKCAICHDKDFCEACEASPMNKHNQTHPLIKFKTAVRDVSVSTIDETAQASRSLGDQGKKPERQASNATPPKYSEKDPELTSDMDITSSPNLDAVFVRDTVVDGSKMHANVHFVQTWSLRNPGPNAWPAGCIVRSVGGDNMLNMDHTRPASIQDLISAQESNATDRVVNPGDVYEFSIHMRSPVGAGKRTSYWRLHSPEGIPFGHKLWCDIHVLAPVGTGPVHTHRRPGNGPSAGHWEMHKLQQEQMMRQAREAHKLSIEARKASMGARYSQYMATPDALAPPTYEQPATRMTRMERKFDEVLKRMDDITKMVAEAKTKEPSSQSTQAPATSTRSRQLSEERADDQLEQLKETLKEFAASNEAMAKSAQQEQHAEDPKSEDKADESSSSTMIFPKLEKESPSSSTYADATQEMTKPTAEELLDSLPAAPKTISVAPSETATDATSHSKDKAEALDVDSVDFSDSEDGFLTDEEYDILDASDEEVGASHNVAA